MSVNTSGKLRAVGEGVGLGLAGIAVAFLLVVAVATVLGGAGVDLGPFAFLVLALTLTQGFSFGGLALAYIRYRDWSLAERVSVPSLREVGVVVGGYVLALGLLIVLGVIVQQLGAETAENQVVELGRRNPDTLLLLIPASFLLIGPGEELLYRGVVQGRLRESFAAVPAVLLASALFAAIHFLALSGSGTGRLVHVGVLFFPSLVFGFAYEYTDNLVVPSLIHGAYNATLFTLLYLSLTVGAGAVALP